MCGIVAYFGDAGNSLARLLTGMSAIIYRAPDSTGIGFFGDDQDVLRTRKALGSVPELVKTLLSEPGYPDQGQELLRLFGLDNELESLCKRQKLLLEQEGLGSVRSISGTDYYAFSQLIDTQVPEPLGLLPGYAGNPEAKKSFFIHSAQGFRDCLKWLTRDFDLSSVVIHSLLRTCLQATLDKQLVKEKLQVAREDILQCFDRLFEAFFLDKPPPKPERLDSDQLQSRSFAEKDLWRCLLATEFEIPADYDQDAVRCLFRLMDSILLTRVHQEIDFYEIIEGYFQDLWPDNSSPFFSWKTFYLAEKAANVYGLAAAAAYIFLQEQVLGRKYAHGQVKNNPFALKTNPAVLCSLLVPVIAQGRWAIQSQVTLENAHPFFDAEKNRIVVLNGQFTGETESGLKDFLQNVARVNFRSQNSTEYFALLWGHYYDVLTKEKSRFEQIRVQVEKGLEGYALGSQGIDFSVYHQVQAKSPAELDRQAFIQAVRSMLQGGGQFAVCGLSLVSQHCLYVAAHNRPIFVVRRPKSQSYMLVSDINAAMGLFSQEMIHLKIIELNQLQESFQKQLARYKDTGQDPASIKSLRRHYQEKEKELLKDFSVEVTPLEGQEIFACIESKIQGDFSVLRSMSLSDFDGNQLADLEPFTTMLNPAQIRNEVHKTFYEAHLHEIPDRLEDILHMYEDEENKLSCLPLKYRTFSRRFGDDLSSLKRIVFIGTGSAYNMGIMAKRFMQRLLPDLDVMVIRPVESEDLSRIIFAEKDLVLLLSWSGTTADMVDCAQELLSLGVLQIGVSAKTFADMALITRKSVGVLPIYSGEEITVSGIKSTVCMLFTLDIFCIWLAQNLGYKQKAGLFWDKLVQIPEELRTVLNNEEIKSFCEQMAAQSANSYANIIVDALHSTGTGIEAALKLEENSWESMGKPLDYWDLEPAFLRKDMQKNLVLVSSTIEERFTEALEAMETLYLKGVPFVALSALNRQERDVRLYSGNRCIFLPKLDDGFQPLVDLLFYYLFGFYYGLAHGRIKGRFPRNRAKSVTAGIKPEHKPSSPAKELLFLEEKNRLLNNFGNNDKQSLQNLAVQESSWEQSGLSERQRAYFTSLRALLSNLAETEPLQRFLSVLPENFEQLGKVLHNEIGEGGEVIFVPLDRKADAAAKNAVQAWRFYLHSFLRVAAPGEALAHFSPGSLVIVLSTRAVEKNFLLTFLADISCKCLWIGPGICQEAERIFKASLGTFLLSNAYSECSSALLYLLISQIFIQTKSAEPRDKGLLLKEHFYFGACYCLKLLNNIEVLQELKQINIDNQAYNTGFYIGPPTGTGLALTDEFDKCQGKILQSHNFGEPAHGPLVTVDAQVENKYIRLRPKEQMLKRYGQNLVAAWEETYLQGQDLDVFLSQSGQELPFSIKRPFFARGNWFLPVLRKEYRTENDNLIILDATSERHFARALDELSSFGCRFARMAVISQEAFEYSGKLRGIYKYPLSNLVLLPAFKANNQQFAVSELLLPLVLDIVGVALTLENV